MRCPLSTAVLVAYVSSCRRLQNPGAREAFYHAVISSAGDPQQVHCYPSNTRPAKTQQIPARQARRLQLLINLVCDLMSTTSPDSRAISTMRAASHRNRVPEGPTSTFQRTFPTSPENRRRDGTGDQSWQSGRVSGSWSLEHPKLNGGGVAIV